MEHINFLVIHIKKTILREWHAGNDGECSLNADIFEFICAQVSVFYWWALWCIDVISKVTWLSTETRPVSLSLSLVRFQSRLHRFNWHRSPWVPGQHIEGQPQVSSTQTPKCTPAFKNVKISQRNKFISVASIAVIGRFTSRNLTLAN